MIISFSVIFMELGDGTVWWSHNISAAEKVKDDVCISGGAVLGGAGRGGAGQYCHGGWRSTKGSTQLPSETLPRHHLAGCRSGDISVAR